jgi:hypothetical protein
VIEDHIAQHHIAHTEDILEQNLLKEVEVRGATVDNFDCAIWLDDCRANRLIAVEDMPRLTMSCDLGWQE